MKVLVWKQLKWSKFHFYGGRLSGKFIHGINIANSVSGKITQEEQSPLIRRQVVWRNCSGQMTEKQNSVKTCNKSPKKETPSIYGNLCRFDQKRKGCPYKAGMNRLKSYKAANCYSAKSFFKYRSQQQQLASSSNERTQPLVTFLINTCLRSEFSAQFCRNSKTFPFTSSDVQLQ